MLAVSPSCSSRRVYRGVPGCTRGVPGVYQGGYGDWVGGGRVIPVPSQLLGEGPQNSGAGPGSPAGAGVGGSEGPGVRVSWYHPPGPVGPLQGPPCTRTLSSSKCRLLANSGEIEVNIQ